jgi:O-antigen/teichoic acid export membrane protein
MFKILFKREIIWGYFAQSLNIGAGLLLLPIILHELNNAQVGLWFVFITISSLGQLIEFGLQPTISRNVTYIYSGVNYLVKSGLAPINKNDQFKVDYRLLGNLLSTAKSLYKKTASIAALIFFLPATYYINSLLDANSEFELISWILYSSGILISLYGGYYSSFLIGRGDITLSNKVVVLNKLIFISLSSIALVNGFGLIGIGLASIVSNWIGFNYLRRYFFSEKNAKYSYCAKTSYEEVKEIKKILWHNASKLGYVQVGAFLIQKSNILLASSVLGLADAAGYGMTLSILTALSSIAISIFQINLPKFNRLQVNNDKNTLKKLYIEYLFISIIIFTTGLITLILFGKNFLTLINSSTKLISNPQILVLGLIILLELNHSIAAIYLTTKNYIPFVAAALISGSSVVVLAYITMPYLGLWALIIAQGVVQIFYNNWKWPLVVMHDLYKR